MDSTTAMDIVKERKISYLYRKSNHDSSIVYPVALPSAFQTFLFPRVPLSQYKTCTLTTRYCKY